MSFKQFFSTLHEEMHAHPNEAVFLHIVGKNLVKKNQKLFMAKGKMDFKDLAAAFKKFELGNISLKELDYNKKTYTVVLKKSCLKTKHSRCSCNLVSGLLAGYTESKTGLYTGCLETRCISKGSPECEFRVKITGDENGKNI